MATISAIRDGLATRLNTVVPALEVHRTRPSNPHPPMAIIRYKGRGPDLTLGGKDPSHHFEIILAVKLGPKGEVAEDALDPYMDRSGAASLQAAILGDETLGGAVSYCQFDDSNPWDEPGFMLFNATEYWGSMLHFKVQE